MIYKAIRSGYLAGMKPSAFHEAGGSCWPWMRSFSGFGLCYLTSACEPLNTGSGIAWCIFLIHLKKHLCRKCFPKDILRTCF